MRRLGHRGLGFIPRFRSSEPPQEDTRMPEQSELSALADPYGQRRRRSPSQDEIAGATCIELDVHADPRGSLIALEKAQGLPFALTRVFCIFDVPPGLERANHAVSAHTFLLAING